jgi:hypothetical protein
MRLRERTGWIKLAGESFFYVGKASVKLTIRLIDLKTGPLCTPRDPKYVFTLS